MLTHYLLLSIILSLIGGILYFSVLQKRLNVLHAKYTLFAIITLSWIVPLLIPGLPNYTKALQAEYLFDYSEYNQWNVVDIKDNALVACYEKATSSKEQCSCEIQQQSNIILYQNDPLYNFLLSSKQPIWLFLIFMGSLFILEFFLKWSSLLYLVTSSKKTKEQLAGFNYYRLSPNIKLPVAISSFTLWKHYIITGEDFELQFTEAEQEAILLHEIAHLKQHDTWQQLGLILLKTFWWLSPILFYIRQELDRLNEFVADDYAVRMLNDRNLYARTLLKAKTIQQEQKQLSLALAFAKGLFRQRIIRLAEQPSEKHLPVWIPSICLVALFWITSIHALPALQKQDIALRQYEILKEKSNNSVENATYCKSCLIDELKSTK